MPPFYGCGCQKNQADGRRTTGPAQYHAIHLDPGAEVKAGNLDELTITTNGSQLGKMADDLYAAGAPHQYLARHA